MKWLADLESVRDAKEQAVRTIGEMLRDDAASVWADRGATMTVSDASDLMLFRIDINTINAPALG